MRTIFSTALISVPRSVFDFKAYMNLLRTWYKTLLKSNENFKLSPPQRPETVHRISSGHEVKGRRQESNAVRLKRIERQVRKVSSESTCKICKKGKEIFFLTITILVLNCII